MPFSLGSRNKRGTSRFAHLLGTVPVHSGRVPDSFIRPTRLVDLRRPSRFRTGFIPGSYNVPDLACLVAARQSGFLHGREIYLLADSEAEVELFYQANHLTGELKLGGWFGSDALDEWRRAPGRLQELEAVNEATLRSRLARTADLTAGNHLPGGNSLVPLAVRLGRSTDRGRLGNGFPFSPLLEADALHFDLRELPLALEGLPVETSICVMSANDRISSFATSLLWNFGFHRICYLRECSVAMGVEKRILGSTDQAA